MKEKLKNKGFWISLVSAGLTVLVILGIISNPASGSGYTDVKSDGSQDKAEDAENIAAQPTDKDSAKNDVAE